MKPNKYPYSKPQWRREVSNIFVWATPSQELSGEPQQ